MALRKADAEALSRHNREVELSRRVAGWADFATEERGFNWEMDNYLTEYWGNEFQAAMTAYVNGDETDIKVVHAIFSKYANAHRRRYRVSLRTNAQEVLYRRRAVPFENVVVATPDDDAISLLSVETVTPQWVPSSEFAKGMFEFFGVVPITE